MVSRMSFDASLVEQIDDATNDAEGRVVRQIAVQLVSLDAALDQLAALQREVDNAAPLFDLVAAPVGTAAREVDPLIDQEC